MVKITKDHIDLSNNILLQATKMPFTGTISLWSSQTLPANALLCDGKQYNVVDYPDLAEVLGSNSSKFTVPDFRARFPLGGNSSNLGTMGGEKQIQGISHFHTVDLSDIYKNAYSPGKVELGNGGTNQQLGSGSTDITIPNNTDDDQIDYLPPYTAINYIIHT